ncbi:MAG: hypothetical protein WCY53_07260 [Sphaerochaetaceae bacterium]
MVSDALDDVHREFDNFKLMIQNQEMKKSLLLFLLLCLLLFKLSAFETTKEALLLSPFKGELPNHSVLGVLSDPITTENEAEFLTFKALNDIYDNTWFENYVSSDAVYYLNKMFADLLRNTLPAKAVVGRQVVKGNLRVVDAMINDSLKITLTWEEEADNSLKIILISAD